MPIRLEPETRERHARRILQGYENSDGIVSTIKDRAACGEWPIPETIEEQLAWILDEANVQIDQVIANPGEINRLDYASVLFHIVYTLTDMGFVPALLPWQK